MNGFSSTLGICQGFLRKRESDKQHFRITLSGMNVPKTSIALDACPQIHRLIVVTAGVHCLNPKPFAIC